MASFYFKVWGEKGRFNSGILRNIQYSHPEGYVDVNGSSYSYVYQYKDHLGNIRLSYKDNNNNGVITTSEILEENNYYPFGLKHKGYNTVVNSTSPALKYKFGGKEYQDELGLGWYDVTARNYDAALGRWMNLDLLSENHFDKSPYNYAINNPINVIDPDGNDVILIIWLPGEGREDVGHAALAVSNYKKDDEGNYLEDKDGNYIEDGTYTLYDFSPAGGRDNRISLKSFNKTVKGDVGIQEGVTLEDIKNNSIKGISSFDGAIQIKTSGKYDEKAKKLLEQKEGTEFYNFIDNNCSDFCMRAFPKKLDSFGKESVIDYKDRKKTVRTQTKLFRDLGRIKGSTVIVDPGEKVNKSAQKVHDEKTKSLTWFDKIKMD